jgi:hypothetical protein
MRLFKKRKARSVIESPLSVRFNRTIEQKQRKAARYLGCQTQHWNRGSKLISLALFCLLFGGCCLWLILKAVL